MSQIIMNTKEQKEDSVELTSENFATVTSHTNMRFNSFDREQLINLVKLERERHITFFIFGMCLSALVFRFWLSHLL